MHTYLSIPQTTYRWFIPIYLYLPISLHIGRYLRIVQSNYIILYLCLDNHSPFIHTSIHACMHASICLSISLSLYLFYLLLSLSLSIYLYLLSPDLSISISYLILSYPYLSIYLSFYFSVYIFF